MCHLSSACAASQPKPPGVCKIMPDLRSELLRPTNISAQFSAQTVKQHTGTLSHTLSCQQAQLKFSISPHLQSQSTQAGQADKSSDSCTTALHNPFCPAHTDSMHSFQSTWQHNCQSSSCSCVKQLDGGCPMCTRRTSPDVQCCQLCNPSFLFMQELR
jgi:hypothetical protein